MAESRSKSIERLQYSAGQLLDVDDFKNEQEYHREMRLRHNRSVHSWGIVEGLTVTVANNKITIAPGTALDNKGQELCLLGQMTLDLETGLKSTVLYVTATFKFDGGKEVTKNSQHLYWTRTIEQVEIAVTATKPPADGSVIVLAILEADEAGTITVKLSDRSRSVGSRIDPAADLTVGRLSLQGPNAKRGALFLAGLGDFNHALYNNNSNIDGEGVWDGAKWNVGGGLNIRLGAGTNKQSALFIKDSRNVGIGTTDPRSTLSVAGGLAVGATYAKTHAVPANDLLVEGKVGIGATSPGAKLEIAIADNDASTNPLAIGKGAVPYLMMLNNGNVGIGSEPDAKLHVTGPLTATRDNEELVGLRINPIIRDGRKSGVKYYGLIVANGNVGIGATAPVATLQIGETISYRDRNYDLSASKLLVRAKDHNGGKTPAATQSVLALVREGMADQAYGNMVDFRLGRWEHHVNYWSRSQLDIYLTDGEFVPQHVMSLRGNGNVGIGTSTPNAFQVTLPESSKGGNAPGAGVTIAGGDNASIELRGTGTPYIDFAKDAITTDFHARIRLTGTDKLAIEGANVGIGTKAPGAKLEVAGEIKFSGEGLKTDALGKITPFYLKGTGMNNSSVRMLIIGSTTVYDTVTASGRGLTLTIINKSDHKSVSTNTYDTYGGGAVASDKLATALNGITKTHIGILTSFDAWEWQMTPSLRNAFYRVGLYKAAATPADSQDQGGRRPYAAIFEASSSSKENTSKAVEVLYSNDKDAPFAEICGWLIDGSFIATGVSGGGPILEQLDVIETKNQADWTTKDHPIVKYFIERLRGKPRGTYMKAYQDHKDWSGFYFEAWVSSPSQIKVTNNRHGEPSTYSI